MPQTISDALAWWSRKTPDTKAVVIDGKSLTYRALNGWADQVAAELVEDGLERGDRVCVLASNSMEYCALVMGVIRAGGIMCPMSVRLTASELREYMDDVAPAMIFSDSERRPILQDLGAAPRAIERVAEWRKTALPPPHIDLSPDDVVAIIATSGSTAKPKGVMSTHGSLINGILEFAVEEEACKPGARLILLAPFSTSAGLMQLIHYTIIGATMYAEPGFKAERALDLIENEKISVFLAVPVFFEQIAACESFSKADVSSLKLAVVGGARVSHALLETWRAKGVLLRQMYGLTECGGTATLALPETAIEHPEKCGVGRIFTQIRIVSETGEICAPGAPGEITIRGPGLMKGYWNNPTATAEALRNGWLYTGDIGEQDANGALTYVDRKKDIIISGGLNISAAEVERAIAEFGGVEEVVVVAADDVKFGETPMAVIYARNPINIEALIAHCNALVADYKVPRYVVVEREPLPRTATGKLSKPAVRQKYKHALSSMQRVR